MYNLSQGSDQIMCDLVNKITIKCQNCSDYLLSPLKTLLELILFLYGQLPRLLPLFMLLVFIWVNDSSGTLPARKS